MPKVLKDDINSDLLSHISTIEGVSSFHTFYPGQVIYYKGHHPYGLFILAEGEVEAEKKKEKVKVETPAILGLEEFLKNKVYTATVKSLTMSKVYFLSILKYNDLNNINHPLANLINKNIKSIKKPRIRKNEK